MATRSPFCCFPIEIAVRMIGVAYLITYLSVFTFLCSGVTDVIDNVKIRIIFGLDSRFFFPSDADTEINHFSAFCLVFSAISIISSTLLICSSITKQRIQTAPWIICSGVNIFTHLTSFALIAVSSNSTCDKWVTIISVIYTAFLMYVSVVVLVAQYSWRATKQERKRFSSRRKNKVLWEDVFRPPPQTTTTTSPPNVNKNSPPSSTPAQLLVA